MSSSSDNDDGSVCSSPVVGCSQHTAFDTGLDLDNTLRQQRQTFRKQRMQKIEERRLARQRQVERKRRQFCSRGKNDVEENNASGDSSFGSADLLASPTPASSPPCPSPSPPCTSLKASSRISNSRGRHHPSKNASGSGNQPLDTEVAMESSPTSSILNYKMGGKPPSPNRVIFSRRAASSRRSYKNNVHVSNHKVRSPTHKTKWASRYTSDSDDDNRHNRKNTNNAASFHPQRKKSWAPKYDSGTDEEEKNTSNVVRYPVQKRKAWAPKYDSDSDDEKRRNNKDDTSNATGSLLRTKNWTPRYENDSYDHYNKTCNVVGSPVQKEKTWAPRYDSDSDDDNRRNNKNDTSNAVTSPAQRKKSWAPKYDSGSDEEKNNSSNVVKYAVQKRKVWAPTHDSDSDDDKWRSNNNDITNIASTSPPRTQNWAPTLDSNSVRENHKYHGETKNTAATRLPPAPRKNPWGYDSDSDVDRSKLHAPTKATNERRVIMKVAATATSRFDSDSDSSSEDDFEAMKKRLREKNEREKVALATAPSKYITASAKPSSPLDKAHASSQRPTAAVRKRSRLAQLTQDSDDTDESFGGAMMRGLHAKKQTEEARLRADREARYKNNPLALERRKQEEKIIHKNNHNNMADAVVTGHSCVARTTVGASGLEGTEIFVGESAEDTKSVSEMRDEASKRGRSSATPVEYLVPRRPSRGTYNRRTCENNNDSDDELGSPKKIQRCSNKLSSQSQGKVQYSEDDGLWDDSDDDNKRKCGDDDSDSDNDGVKKKRGRCRQRGSRGSSTAEQPRKRSRSKANTALKAADSSDAHSDVPNIQHEKSVHRMNKVPRRSNSIDSTDKNVEPQKQRLSNGSGGSRWASRYRADNDDLEEKPVSDDEIDRRQGQLKPTFANPKLGPPSPLVPFALSKTWNLGDPFANQRDDDENGGGDGEDDDCRKATTSMDKDDVDKVPASINRYLQEYQRAGIQFMYSSVVHGKGCVLGDDMGLGKTVQLISLIAALLKKTGTGLDELEIYRHRSKVVKAMRAEEESKHKALLTGFGLKDNSALGTIEVPKVTPILIIVPPSVVQNWQNEFETWGHFTVGVYSGQSREKALERIQDGRDFILIVGKSLFVRVADYDQIASIEWKLVIVDEFHEFKNGKSQGYKRLSDLRDNSGCPVIGMTGTLMQNNHDELYYLIDLVRPFLLGDIKEFRDEISRPVMYARAKDAKEGVVRLADKQEQLLRKLIKDVYLERKKEQVLKDSLTQKNERVIFCELSEIQKKIYRHILTLPDFQLLRFANAPCDCGVNKSYFRGYSKMRTHKEQLNYQRRHKKDLMPQKKCCYKYPFNPRREELGEPQIDQEAILWIQAHQKPIGSSEDIQEDILDGKYIACMNCPNCVTFAAMNKLYKISSHPALLQVDPCESGPDAKKKLQFAQVALTPDILRGLPGGTHWKSDGIMDDHIALSGKMKSLDYLLRKYFRRRNRVLIFSYSTAALDLIQNHIKGQGWTNLRLDGQTPTSQRQGLVDKFQNDDSIQIFLISTKAGGLGLNLTAANKVIIFDVNWNPSYDEQAQDRAYRIGQKRDVETVRLVARGTIEELIYARQVYKVQLKKQTLGHNIDGRNQPQIFRGVAKDKNRKGELFGLENLLKFKDGSFMSLLWKSSDNPLEEHDVSALAKELENMNEDQLDDLAEKGDEAPANNDDNSDRDYDIDHQHLFSMSKGRAQIAPGDKHFEDEMGGESQVVEVAAKLACERMRADEDDIEDNINGEDQDYRHGGYDHPAAAASSLVKDLPNGVGRDSIDTSTISLPVTAKRPSIPFPSPVKSVDNHGERVKTDEKTARDDDCCTSPIQSPEKPQKDANAESSEKQSPDRSAAGQSTCSFEGLRTQPTPQQPSPKQMAPQATKRMTSKFTLMGTVFEKPKEKKNQRARKKFGGLYIPKYSKN